MGKIEIILGDITKLQVDAIVNAANTTLLGGGGVDGAIHRAAGPQLLAECRTLNGCNTGEAKITGGYNLPAKYVIHTVGPVWRGGNQREPELLESCYAQSLKLAVKNNLKTIAFPNISTGVYSFPKQSAATIAIESVVKFLNVHPELEKVIFCCFDRENFDIYNSIKEVRTDFFEVNSPEDISIVAELADEIWHEHYVPIIGEEQVKYMVEKFQSPEAITKQINEENFDYYIILQSFEPAGYIGLKPSGDELVLSKFYIRKNNRGNGLGKKSIGFTLQYAKKLHYKIISLTVNKYNTNSIKAYEKMGFKNQGPVTADIGNGFIMDDYQMKYFISL